MSTFYKVVTRYNDGPTEKEATHFFPTKRAARIYMNAMLEGASIDDNLRFTMTKHQVSVSVKGFCEWLNQVAGSPATMEVAA